MSGMLFVTSIRNGDVTFFSETFLNSPPLRRGTQSVCGTIARQFGEKMVQIHECRFLNVRCFIVGVVVFCDDDQHCCQDLM